MSKDTALRIPRKTQGVTSSKGRDPADSVRAAQADLSARELLD